MKKKFLKEILEMYAEGEISAGKAAEMLGIPRAAFYQLLAEKRIPLPEKLNQSILKELKKLETKKD
jgi:predicted HTH domain antitoxin